MSDRFEDMFAKQAEFMELLRQNDKIPEWPVDMTSKPGQRLIKETIFNLCEELFEASFTLKNRVHRMSDARLVDMDHYKEELGDAMAYFIEVCIFSGFSPEEMYQEYIRKNQVVRDRLKKGY